MDNSSARVHGLCQNLYMFHKLNGQCQAYYMYMYLLSLKQVHVDVDLF